MKKARILPSREKDDGVCLRVCKITRVSEHRTVYSTIHNRTSQHAMNLLDQLKTVKRKDVCTQQQVNF